MDENLIISWSTSYNTKVVSIITHLSIVVPKQFPYFHQITNYLKIGPFENKVTVTPRPKMDENQIVSWSTSNNTTKVLFITHLSFVIPKEFPNFHQIHELGGGRNPISPPHFGSG